jgi:hypothetical protein
MPASTLSRTSGRPQDAAAARAWRKNGLWCHARRFGAGRDRLTGGAARRGMRLVAVLTGPGTCAGKRGAPWRSGWFVRERAAQASSAMLNHRPHLPAATLRHAGAVKHDGDHPRFKPRCTDRVAQAAQGGTARGLPATLIAANLVPSRLSGPTEPPHRSGNCRSRGSKRSNPQTAGVCASTNAGADHAAWVYRLRSCRWQQHRERRHAG